MARAKGHGGITVRLLTVLGLLFLSFAHQPAIPRMLSPDAAASLVLPDGTVADICFGMDGVDGKDHQDGKRSGPAPICEACRLAAAFVLPPPPDSGHLIAVEGSFRALPLRFTQLLIAHPRPLPPSRAPPVQL